MVTTETTRQVIDVKVHEREKKKNTRILHELKDQFLNYSHEKFEKSIFLYKKSFCLKY